MKKHEQLAEDLFEFLIRLWGYKDWSISRSLTPPRDKELLGITHPATRTIQLFPIPKNRTDKPGSVLAHELLHVCHDGKMCSTQLGKDLEESIGKLETSFYRCASKRVKKTLDLLVEGNERVLEIAKLVKHPRLRGKKHATKRLL